MQVIWEPPQLVGWSVSRHAGITRIEAQQQPIHMDYSIDCVRSREQRMMLFDPDARMGS